MRNNESNEKIYSIILKKRSFLFHVIASILTFGIWILLYWAIYWNCKLNHTKFMEDFNSKHDLVKEKKNINKCPKCGSTNLSIQMVNSKKNKFILTRLILFLIKFILFLFNWILWIISLLIPGMKKNKDTTKKIVICQNCGNSWNIR